jgi:hypothetical protein
LTNIFINKDSQKDLLIATYTQKLKMTKLLIVVVYVDDIIFGSNEESMSQKFASDMQQEFEMSLLGKLTFFLGLQVQQAKDGIFLSQTKYLKQILKKYGMEDCKPVSTPMITGCNLSANDDSPTINQPEYRSMIGSLLYLTGTRPDIMHAVGIVGRFQANPRESHLQAVKEYSNIYKELKILDYGTQGMLILLFMHTLMQIGLGVLMIERALVVVHSTWGPG